MIDRSRGAWFTYWRDRDGRVMEARLFVEEVDALRHAVSSFGGGGGGLIFCPDGDDLIEVVKNEEA